MSLNFFRLACHLLLPFISSEFRCSKLVGWRGASQECLPGQPTESMEHKWFVTSTPLVYWSRTRLVLKCCLISVALLPGSFSLTLCDQSATYSACMRRYTHSLTHYYLVSIQIAGVLCKILESVQAHLPQCTLVTYTNYDVTVYIINTHHVTWLYSTEKVHGSGGQCWAQLWRLFHRTKI